MKIVAVTSCASGLAHTYIAKSRLEQSAKDLNVLIDVETQGAVGVESVLTKEAIEEANAVLIASDVDIIGMDRFDDKYVVKIPINKVVRYSDKILEKIIDEVQKNNA